MALSKGGERTCLLRNWANEHLVELAPEKVFVKGMRLMSIGANGVGEEPTLY